MKWVLHDIQKEGSTEIWTRIAGFRVQSANHYTIEPRETLFKFLISDDHPLQGIFFENPKPSFLDTTVSKQAMHDIQRLQWYNEKTAKPQIRACADNLWNEEYYVKTRLAYSIRKRKIRSSTLNCIWHF